MFFYDLSKEEREKKCQEIQFVIEKELVSNKLTKIRGFFDDADTYIRKAAYLAIGRLYKNKALQTPIITALEELIGSESEKVRQTVINAGGEIAMTDLKAVRHLFETGLFDKHHSVKNAVQGSLKKAGQKNPKEIIKFSQKYIKHSNPEIRRQIIHGLELRGRTHPEDIVPSLRLLQFEKHKRVRPMLVHIFGQISYKKGCLEKVTAELLTWEDKKLAEECFEEIIKQHEHANRSLRTIKVVSAEDCKKYIEVSKKRVKQKNKK
ncbi:MAG: HEAT repeat domain-containing protein [Treponema sp.]|jgi:hypothetical protein|nr:HEAT repeat domain-containing protein [Treponema sp.]